MPASPSQPDDERRQAEEAAGTAAALAAIAALAKGLADPFLPSRLKRYAALIRGEESLWGAFSKLLDHWLGDVRRRVVRPGGTIDAYAAEAARPAYEAAVDKLLDVQIETIFHEAFDEVAEPDQWEPYGVYRVQDYLAGVRNRMVRTPDSVFDLIRQEVARGVNDGDSVDQMASRIDDILSETGTSTWKNRGLVVARTEAIGAYNAGTLAGFHSLAAQLGGEWEKGWICTHDDRTRPTHLAADIGTPGTGQRVPLGEPFEVGEAALDHPGAAGPAALPEEVIQCRCSMVLLRPGEKIDLSNRHMRGAK